MTTRELLEYYSKLLIRQYLGKARAYATIQALVRPTLMAQTTVETVSFSLVATGGNFTLSYNGVASASIAWNDSAATIQTKLRAITGLGSITVAGSIASKLLTITFTGVEAPALLLAVGTNTLVASTNSVAISIAETDLTLPLIVQNAFDVTSAMGVQLDIIGKYVGVVRTINTFSGPVTLDDSDFRNLIRLKIFTNNAGSSLYVIQQLISIYFPGQILVFDFKNMRIAYFLAVGSLDLAQAVVVQGLLPKPMGVQLSSVIYNNIINAFFGFRTYAGPAVNASPFNNYTTYTMTWPWLSYANAIVA